MWTSGVIMKKSKPVVKITDWGIGLWKGLLKYRACLHGVVVLIGPDIITSRIVKANFASGMVETLNTIYHIQGKSKSIYVKCKLLHSGVHKLLTHDNELVAVARHSTAGWKMLNKRYKYLWQCKAAAELIYMRRLANKDNKVLKDSHDIPTK